jgi:hypothetical protein
MRTSDEYHDVILDRSLSIRSSGASIRTQRRQCHDRHTFPNLRTNDSIRLALPITLTHVQIQACKRQDGHIGPGIPKAAPFGRAFGTRVSFTYNDRLLSSLQAMDSTPAIDERTIMQSYPESPLSNSSSHGPPGPATHPAVVPGTEHQASSRDERSSKPSVARKSRVALACKRCKRRKQRVSCRSTV